MYDQNSCKFSGKVEAFKQVKTKTGKAMIVFTLRCWKEYFKIIAFDELAETTFSNDDRVEVKGKLRTSSYEKDGVKHYGFEIIASSIDQESLKQREPKTAPQYPEHGQRPVASFEQGEPF